MAMQTIMQLMIMGHKHKLSPIAGYELLTWKSYLSRFVSYLHKHFGLSPIWCEYEYMVMRVPSNYEPCHEKICLLHM